jgi:predicted deacylase
MTWLQEVSPGFCGWSTWQATTRASLEVFCCRGLSDGPLVLITAGVHGDEYEGPAAVSSLTELLPPDRVRGTIVAVPVANPAAFAAGTRMHPEDGHNLARTFPGNSKGSPSEQLAAAIFGELVAPAGYVIDLHSGGVEYIFLPVTGFYGEPVNSNPSFEAAKTFGLQALWQLPETGGVLSCEAWRRGKVAIGTEYLGAGQLSPDGIRDYRNGVIACLAHWGILPETPQAAETPAVFAGDWQIASFEGIFTACCSLGDSVLQGTRTALIAGMRGQVLQEFVSPCDGVVLGLRSKAYIRETNWAVLVGGRIV